MYIVTCVWEGKLTLYTHDNLKVFSGLRNRPVLKLLHELRQSGNMDYRRKTKINRKLQAYKCRS